MTGRAMIEDNGGWKRSERKENIMKDWMMIMIMMMKKTENTGSRHGKVGAYPRANHMHLVEKSSTCGEECFGKEWRV
jgi:hypothetical protein